jgi:hypothetical protein
VLSDPEKDLEMKMKYLLLVFGLLVAQFTFAGGENNEKDIPTLPDEALQIVLSKVDASDLSNTALVNHQWRNNSQDKYFLRSYFNAELEALSGIDQEKRKKIENLLFLSAKNLNSKVMFELLTHTKTYKDFFTQNIVSLYAEAAKTRNPLALNNLGIIYEIALGVDQDYKLARELYIYAAQSNCAEAQYYLARMLEHGKGGNKNPKAALRYYTFSAGAGFTPAQNDLGFIYLRGLLGVKKDPQKAFNLFLLASHKNDSYAQNSLGMMYEGGKFVSKDYEMAEHFYTLSANQGLSLGQFNLADLYESLGNIEKAIECYVRASEQGNKKATKALARLVK